MEQFLSKPHLLANKILYFVIVTLFEGSKVVFKIMPVRELDSKFIFKQTNLIFNVI